MERENNKNMLVSLKTKEGEIAAIVDHRKIISITPLYTSKINFNLATYQEEDADDRLVIKHRPLSDDCCKISLVFGNDIQTLIVPLKISDVLVQLTNVFS